MVVKKRSSGNAGSGQRIITHKIGRFHVSYTPKSRKELVKQWKSVARQLKQQGYADVKYSVFRDLLFPTATTGNRELKRGKSHFTASEPLKGVKGAKEHQSFSVIKNQNTGKTIRVYWIKDYRPYGGDRLVVKAHKEKVIIRVKDHEAEDALRQSEELGINTPEFIVRIIEPEKGWMLSVSKEIPEPTVKAEELLQSDKTPLYVKREILRSVENMGIKLIKAGLLPTILRAGHILVTKTSPRRFYLTDNAAGFMPITRNRIILLKYLREHPNAPRPDWDTIHSSFSGFGKYWQSLSPKMRRELEMARLHQLLADMRTPASKRMSMKNMKSLTGKMIVDMFPDSKTAKDIQAGKDVWITQT